MTKKKNGYPQGQGGTDQKDPQHRQGDHKKKGVSQGKDIRGDEDPEKKIQIDDNPDETKRKIPHME